MATDGIHPRASARPYHGLAGHEWVVAPGSREVVDNLAWIATRFEPSGD